MGQLLTTSSVLLCPHGGSVTVVSSNLRVRAAGDVIVRASDRFIVAGCPFTVPPSGPYHPCVTVKWIVPAVRVDVAGDDALTSDSSGMCHAADEAPQGSVVVSFAQPRVSGR